MVTLTLKSVMTNSMLSYVYTIDKLMIFYSVFYLYIL